ncbi:MAG TPA: hypothetical protein VJ990_01655 [Clostridia bacterium]|nr:hypothetical protein [Clostridia bacterium]
MYINRDDYQKLSFKKPECLNKCDSIDQIGNDVEMLMDEYGNILNGEKVKYTSTWLLEKDIFIKHEKEEIGKEEEVLSRGRVVLVNPGVSKIGREQRYMHYYIVLGEHKETFIGVPITNMANNQNGYYLRNFFEVELIDPKGKKPFKEYRCSKRSVADVRNICGLDKRRIVKNWLYEEKKYAPNEYTNSISKKIRETLAIIVK